MLKEIKEAINKWKHIPGSWMRRLNIKFLIFKMPIVLKMIYTVKAIPIKISMTNDKSQRQMTKSQSQNLKNIKISIFRNRKNYPKIHMESQGTQNSQNHLEKEEQSWRSHTSWFQNLLQSNSNQKVWYWSIDIQTNRIK